MPVQILEQHAWQYMAKQYVNLLLLPLRIPLLTRQAVSACICCIHGAHRLLTHALLAPLMTDNLPNPSQLFAVSTGCTGCTLADASLTHQTTYPDLAVRLYFSPLA